MTLTIRSETMERIKSTIVTTAVLVTGLITAAHVLHPRDPASEMRRGRSVVATTDAVAAWSDPPARAARASTADVALLRPASFTLLPIAMTASLSGAEDQLQGQSGQRVEPVHIHKTVRSGARSQAASVRPRVMYQASNPIASSVQPSKAAQGDPIGDLMKALGLGRDSEG